MKKVTVLTLALAVLLLSGGAVRADLTDGLVAYYPLDGNANDQGGNENHGVEYGGVTYTSGVQGQAASFDGVDDYIKASADGLPTAERTVSLWFYANTLNMPRPVLLGYGGTWCGHTWWMALSPSPEPHFYLSGHCHSFDLYGPHFQPPVGAWYHWAITTNADGTKFFVNGQEVASHALFINSTYVNGRDLSIGVNVSGHGFAPYTDINVGWFDGMIDEVRIYNRALSEEEISSLTGFRITSSPRLSVQLGEFSSHQFEAKGGIAPFSWSVIDGTPPPGMDFGSDGILNGTPTQTGEFTFAARVTDSDTRTAEKSFTVEVVLIPPPPDIKVNITGTIPVPGREVTYFVVVENVGTTSASNVNIHALVNPDQFTFLSADPAPVVDDPDTVLDPNTVRWQVPELAPGEVKILTYTVSVKAAVPIGSTVTAAVFVNPDVYEAILCALEHINAAALCGLCAAECVVAIECIVTPGPHCFIAVPDCLHCVTDSCPEAIRIVGEDCYSKHSPAGDSKPQVVLGALDPNEKLVTAKKFIQPDQLLVYPIHFENIGTAEARDIFITDVLDTNLDLTTLEVLTPDGASFDPETRTLRWELLNRDLFPGETDNVLLSIKPLPGLPSGTEIRNNATIQFEVFDPFTTNEVVNVIDTTRPTGIMDPLPAQTSTLEFPISWSGSDGVGEIEYYTVLVSEDSGDFTPFVERTSETSAIFTGESGKTYGFICIAVDTAGNIEVQEAVAEALTKVIVTNKVEVYVDIKPGSCPSPLNVKGKGVLPVAVLGTADFDVAQVDITTLWIEGVAPLGSAYEDVTTPFDPATGKEDCFEDCTYEGPDGFLDLALKFSVQEIVGALGDVEDRQCRVVKLTGTLIDGTPIVGEDVVLILKN